MASFYLEFGVKETGQPEIGSTNVPYLMMLIFFTQSPLFQLNQFNK